MKVCIVGASGKLGQYMVQHALDRGYAVVGVCREQSVQSSTGSAAASRLFPEQPMTVTSSSVRSQAVTRC